MPCKENKENEDFPVFVRQYSAVIHAFIVIIKLSFKRQRKFFIIDILNFYLRVS